MDKHVYDYIIVGAGLAGLQAAQILSAKTTNFLVIEAQSKIGGRIQTNYFQIKQSPTQPLKTQLYVEMGATWIQERHTYMQRLCKNLGIKLQKQYNEGHNMYVSKQKQNSEDMLQDSEIRAQILNFFSQIDKFTAEYKNDVLDNSNVKGDRYIQKLSKYDSLTVEQFLKANVRCNKVRDLIGIFLQHTECLNNKKNSMHQVLTKHARSNDIGILKQFFGLEQEEPSYVIEKGSSSVIQGLVQEIKKKTQKPLQEILRTNCQIVQVNNSRSDIVVVQCQQNQTETKFLKAKHIICSVPLQVVSNISFTNISEQKQMIFNNQMTTNCIKVFAFFDRPFWRELDKSGDCIFSKDWLVNMCHDVSPVEGNAGILVFFINGVKYEKWKCEFNANECESQKEKHIYIQKLINFMFATNQSPFHQNSQIMNVQNLYTTSFNSNLFIRSGFQSTTRPGTFTQLLQMEGSFQDLFSDEHNLTFIGSEFSKQFASYMEGAIRCSRKKCYALIGDKDPYQEAAIKQQREIRIEKQL